MSGPEGRLPNRDADVVLGADASIDTILQKKCGEIPAGGVELAMNSKLFVKSCWL